MPCGPITQDDSTEYDICRRARLFFSAPTNGYSGYAVEGADCALLPGGAWDWAQITNYTVNPDGSISVPLDAGGRRVIRLKLNP